MWRGGARKAGDPGAQRPTAKLSERTGMPWAVVMDKSWTHLGHAKNGEKLEGCRGLGVKRPPQKKRGVIGGVVRPANVGGARVAVVSIGRTYWQNLSGATHTRDVGFPRLARMKKYRRAPLHGRGRG